MAVCANAGGYLIDLLRIKTYDIMEYKCCMVNCRSNYAGEERSAVFYFPKEEDLKLRWTKFLNRKDWQPTSSSYICIKHFESKYYKKGEKDQRFRLMKELKPVPTIYLILQRVCQNFHKLPR